MLISRKLLDVKWDQATHQINNEDPKDEANLEDLGTLPSVIVLLDIQG